MSLTMYAKELLAMHFAFDEFGHILWGAQKLIIVMTDNKALTRFFQARHIPTSLWTNASIHFYTSSLSQPASALITLNALLRLNVLL